MYKVVVADDELLLLRSIKKSIEDAHKGFSVVGEALNGKDAFHIIQELEPDLIFTDIRMPVVDGLALIEELRIRQIQTKVIILSGYNEFDYAKKALKFGVEEYLLKPVSHDELKELLDKIYNDLEDLKSGQQYKVLESLVSKDINNVIPSSQISKYFADCNFYGAILICAGSLCTFTCNWITPAKDFWLNMELKALLENTLQTEFKHWVLDTVNGNEKLIILGAVDEFQDKFLSACKNIFDILEKEHFPITAVACKPINSIYDLPYIIQHYRILLSKIIIFGGTKLLLPGATEVTDKNTEPLIDINSEKLLTMYIEKNQLKHFKAELKKLLDSYEAKNAHQFRLESLLKHLVNLFQSCGSHVTQSRLVEIKMKIDELISNSFKYQTIYEGISIIFENLFNSSQKLPAEKSDQKTWVDNVEAFIRQNYSQQISMQKISEDFGLTLPYLSSIFKKHKGISPMEYIINLRIEKAKELLKANPLLTLKDIAQVIGYDDPYYMSRIFKLVTGKSPSEFRRL